MADKSPQDNARTPIKDEKNPVTSSGIETKEAATGRAAESGDPAIQQLLARRQAHAMNQQDDEVRAIDEELVRLGFTEYRAK